MDKIEKIRQEIKRRKNYISVTHFAEELLSFLDTLEEERPEPYNPVYNEDYLNEKIAKATKSWKGVDVDAMLADCRGYEEPDKSLEETAEEYVTTHLRNNEFPTADSAFKAGAEWQKSQMLKDAVEGYVNYYEDSGGKLMAEAQVGCPYHMGDKVKIIIVKED